MLVAKEDKLKNLISLLESVNYQRVLERGFALVKDADGKLVTSAKQAHSHPTLTVTFKDGDLTVMH